MSGTTGENRTGGPVGARVLHRQGANTRGEMAPARAEEVPRVRRVGRCELEKKPEVSAPRRVPVKEDSSLNDRNC